MSESSELIISFVLMSLILYKKFVYLQKIIRIKTIPPYSPIMTKYSHVRVEDETLHSLKDFQHKTA